MNSRKIIQEIDSRLEKLGSHYHDKKNTDGNPYGEMLAAATYFIQTLVVALF